MGSANIRAGLTASEIKQAFRDNLRCGLGRLERFATKHDVYVALALTVRDRLLERTVESLQTYGGADARRVAYLSAEFLPGPHFANNLLNLGITEVTREALRELGYDLDEILAHEAEPDPFLLLADYQSYIDAQERVSTLWRTPQAWTLMSILNTARMDKFSSDRSIRDYCEHVWNIEPRESRS